MSPESFRSKNADFRNETVDPNILSKPLSREKRKGKGKSEKNNYPSKSITASLRKIDNEEDQFDLFKVSSEVRNDIAKQLSKFLENRLNNSLKSVKDKQNLKKKRLKTGIKLFSDSNSFIKVSKLNDDDGQTSLTKRVKSVEFSEETVQEIRKLAVDPQDILNKKDIQHWSNRSKAPIFYYKKSAKGILKLIE